MNSQHRNHDDWMIPWSQRVWRDKCIPFALLGLIICSPGCASHSYALRTSTPEVQTTDSTAVLANLGDQPGNTNAATGTPPTAEEMANWETAQTIQSADDTSGWGEDDWSGQPTIAQVAYQEEIPPGQMVPLEGANRQGSMVGNPAASEALPLSDQSTAPGYTPGNGARQQPTDMSSGYPSRQPGMLPQDAPGQAGMAAQQPSHDPAVMYQQPQHPTIGFNGGPATDGRPHPYLRQQVNVQGSQFRIPPATASEQMVGLYDFNQQLQAHIVSQNQQLQELQQRYDAEVETRKSTEQQLATAETSIDSLKKAVAKLQVQIDTLEREKTATELRADRAMRTIESSLDKVLMETYAESIKDK